MGDAAENSIASRAMGDMAWATKMDKIHNMSIATGRWGHVATWVTKNGGLNVHNISIATEQWETPQKQYRLSGDGGHVVGDKNGEFKVHNISTAAGRWGHVATWETKMEDSKSTT